MRTAFGELYRALLTLANELCLLVYLCAFSWVAFSVAMAYAFGGFISGKLVSVFGPNRLVNFGLSLMLSAGLLMVILGLCGWFNSIVVIGPIAVYLVGASFVFPNAFAQAFQPFANIAGIASALFGCFQIVGGSIASSIMVYTTDTNQYPLGVAFIIVSIIGLVVLKINNPK